MENNFLDQASVWGRVFEIAVQRGVLAQLMHQGLLLPSHPALKEWHEHRIADITKGVNAALKTTDPNAKEWTESGTRHLLVFGYGLGWSTMRACLAHNAPKQPRIEAIWCPLTLPGAAESPVDVESDQDALAFKTAFNLPGPADHDMLQTGYPGRADFLLWLKSGSPAVNRKNQKPQDLILCLEFSCNALPELADFRTEAPHCDEIHRYARYMESRGVFARVCAEVGGSELKLSHQLADHLKAFSGKDKPLYKLCQASSYTERLVHVLVKQGRFQRCKASAIAVTSNGLESISAAFAEPDADLDPRVQLMASLGRAYRQASQRRDISPADLQSEIRLVFNKLVRSLPSDFRKQARQIGETPDLDGPLEFRLTETVEDFYKPMQQLSVEAAIASLQSTPALEQFFGSDPRSHLASALNQRLSLESNITLRNAHAAAVVAGLKAAQPGKLNVIALEGNPGIGKTTAVTQFLSEQTEGYCFLYVSPRVVINRDVTAKLAHNSEGQPRGILTLTSNAKLISAAPQWHEQQTREQPAQRRQIDGAVVVDGVTHLKHPICNTLFISPDDEQKIDTDIVSSKKYKQSLNEREDSVRSKERPGVLRTLATSARKLLKENPKVNRLVMTAAIQGYRALKNRTTVDALSKLFKNKADTRLGIQERKAFAQKIPTIIAMVDEVAGDGAGALFCHSLAEWLSEQFIAPFEGEDCPFRVVLIISDASLSNEVVLNSYLNSGDRAPDKILISPTAGSAPFRVTGTKMKVGLRKYPTLHVMTNSYPASTLQIDYSIRLASITPGLTDDGQLQSIRKAVRDQAGEELLKNAQAEIELALKAGAEQIIYFAQDKAFLRQLRESLTAGGKEAILPAEQVKVLDQSVPEADRLKLVQEPQRDDVRVFLMTSSGARGVSFPKTDRIIASVPRFNVEAALMEVAQLIYRGRGWYTDPATGEQRSGDDKARRLVMLINDFVIDDGATDRDRRWLRQSSDLLTLLVMLRSTIHTRIKGDAGLRRQRIAFVPVGFVGDEELLSLLSTDLRDFLQEAQVFLHDSYSDEEKALVTKASQLVKRLFAHFQLKGKSPHQKGSSFVDYDLIEGLSKTVSRPNSSLLAIPDQKALIIPPELTCAGPFWIEDWRGRRSEESFSFESWRRDINESRGSLLGLLRKIFENRRLPSKLKHPAKELHRLLIREKEASVREYSTLQDTQTDHMLVALPIDYPHFWREQTEDGVRQKLLEDPATWRNALGRALIPQGVVMPVVARYEGFPWAAVAGQRAISQLATVFDNRYFMASSELNLLNTILLEDIAGSASE
ncbi:helicase [Romeria aff. gracilis LEGE 07310]|uniref:Helicase n=1 Tax=Vasconcelosia minhoensis LEGE 07310 TaxID=915328 RepID=A0A8J7DD57_9CYAN|nr:helicase-related protein [Romeria gracilis]MBE9078398.1 helicase [Romeria aff. gracilis LEGE 07310]